MTKIVADDGQSTAEVPVDIDVRAAVASIFDGHDFSDEFKTKVAKVITGLIDAESGKRVQHFKESYDQETLELVEELKNAYEEKITTIQEQQTSQMSAELVEKLDDYLSYAAETWLEENKIAVESGLRVQIAEEMIKSMTAVLSESMIVLNPERVDAVARLEEEVQALTERTNSLIKENRRLGGQLLTERKRGIVESKLAALTESQKDRIRPILEACDSEAEMDSKLRVFNESVNAPRRGTMLNEDLDARQQEIKENNNSAIDPNVTFLANLI